ncbi:MAG: tyrosine-type recombinase/integrase, partial [Ilumatobacteraceae bacterium]
TVSGAVVWAGTAPAASTAADRLAAIHGFARYLQALDPHHEVPPRDLLRAATTRPIPHLYSDTDITTVMAAARTLQPGVWAATMETIVGLLWAAGMRIGEVLRLNVDDLDRDSGVLTVWLSKFGKSRLVPLSPSTCAALDRYRHTIDAAVATNAMFVTADGTRAGYRKFNIDFAHLLDSTGITTAAGKRPRAHDLRHSFAVRTLLGWYRDGADVQALLPRLSTYLGHVEPASTYWYLSAAPELMALAAERLEPVEVDQ